MRRSSPYHSFLGNDEMFAIVKGHGTYRIGNSEDSVGSGDICGPPQGGLDTAHQIINTGDVPMTYLAIS